MEADLLVTCPYNPAHRIAQYKLMNHVVKCKKSAKTENKIECPLDRSHIVDHDNLKEHIATCPSLGKLIDVDTGHVKQERDITDTHRSTENWEEEPEVPSYNPMEMSANKKVIRFMPGLSKSEKKKFRDSERKRIANLKEEINIIKTTPLLVKDVVQEPPLRPPCITSAIFNVETTQNNFDKSRINDTLDTSIQTESIHEFQNLFYKTLYDKLAPECNDTNQQLKHSLYNTDMGASAQNYSQHINGEKKNVSFFNQNHEIKVKKTQLNETFEIFNVDNIKKEKNECVIENTSKTSERVTDKLLGYLKSNSDDKKVEFVEEIKKISQNDRDSEKELKWDDVFNKFNDRLAYLTDIQNAAAEESALLLKQLKELKLRNEPNLKK
ncbi:uncharacterized protein LOC126853187 [Cataglyphis hispanica]|uniref:uncharacterized protein LOC126853187 n=1 Tax=Cataglyphis hispanica TaxID=1086592 RepID=UPI00217FAD64|nr:uncharacterized protein LOC126853187 [Cataglyphis hispanica]